MPGGKVRETQAMDRIWCGARTEVPWLPEQGIGGPSGPPETLHREGLESQARSESGSRMDGLLGKGPAGQGPGPCLAAPAPHAAPLPAAPQSAQCVLPVPAACSSSSSRFLLRSRSPMAGPEVPAGLSPAAFVLPAPGRPWSCLCRAAGEGLSWPSLQDREAAGPAPGTACPASRSSTTPLDNVSSPRPAVHFHYRREGTGAHQM